MAYKLLILFAVLVMGVAYKQVGGAQYLIHPFPFYQAGELLPVTYLFFLFTRINFSILAFVVWSMATGYKTEFLIFALLSVGYLVDFLLQNNMPYYRIGPVSVGFSLLQMVIFGIVIARALWTKS